jgi:hypothetical protein
MRYGLYRLRKNKHKRKDWIYIVDHTIELGSKKAFVILGVPLCEFRRRKDNRNLTNKDVEVLAIDITEEATGESVRKRLEKNAKKCGVPIQVVSDGGRNIRLGLREFARTHPGVRQTYDVMHATALVLKHELEDDDRWLEFSRKITETKRLLAHTKLAYLAPPKPRDKARYMNLEVMVHWAEKACSVSLRDIEKPDREKFKQKLDWLHGFESELMEWRAILDLLSAAKKEVKGMGLRGGSLGRFKRKAQRIRVKGGREKKQKKANARLDGMKGQLESYLTEQTAELKRGAYLGCSDIIESLFGSYKCFSSEAPVKEVGRSILAMPALVGSFNPVEVKRAMETISQKELKKWLRKTFGESMFTKRKMMSVKLKFQKRGEENLEKEAKVA